MFFVKKSYRDNDGTAAHRHVGIAPAELHKSHSPSCAPAELHTAH
jgi:hypothetical protein